MERDERQRAEELDRHWDAVLHGTPIPPAAGSVADLAELVERLHAAEAIPLLFPDPRRAWHDLSRRTTDQEMPPHMPALADRENLTPIRINPNGRLTAPGVDRPRPAILRPAPGWALTQLATAALLLIALAAGYVALYQGRPEAVDDAIPVPALVSMLEIAPGAPAPAGVTEETLFAATFTADELPAGEKEAVFYRLTLPPGASLPYLAGPSCGCPGATVTAGVGAEEVLAGAYTLRLDAPLWVQRSGQSGDREEVPAQTEVILGAGDAAIYPDYAAPAEVRNAGAEPVVLVGVAIVGVEGSGTPAPELPPEVRGELLTRTIPSDWRTLPAGPVTVTLRRLTLPAGASFEPYEAAVLEAMRIETGAISRRFLPPGSFLRLGEAAPSGQPLYQSAGTSVPFMAAPPDLRRVFASVGDEPAVLLVLTIEPAGIGPTTLAP